MSNDIYNDILSIYEEKFKNTKVAELIKEDPSILKKYPLLEIEFNIDGSKKSLSSLASEKILKKHK